MATRNPFEIDWAASLDRLGFSDDDRTLCVLSLMLYLDMTPHAFIDRLFSSDNAQIKLRAGHCLSLTRAAQPMLVTLLDNVWKRFGGSAYAGLVAAIDPIVKDILERESRAAIRCRELSIRPGDIQLDHLLAKLGHGQDGIAYLIQTLMPHSFDWLLHATSSDNEYRRKLRKKNALSAQPPSKRVAADADDHYIEGEAFSLHGEEWHDEFPGFSRNPRLAVTFTLSSLIFVRNRSTNALPLLVGAQMAVHGANTRVNDTFSRFGAVVSRRTIDSFRIRLSNDAVSRAAAFALREPRSLGVLDNVDLQVHKANQRITNRAYMLHITNWALLGLHSSVPLAACDVASFLENRGKRAKAKPSDIRPKDADDLYTLHSFEALVQRILIDNAPGAAQWSNRQQLRDCAEAAMPSRSPLTPEVTQTYPVGVVNANEGSNKGVIRAIELFRMRIGMSKEQWAAHLRVIAGDFLTIRNIRSARHLRQGDVDAVERLETIVPQAQLFHFSLNAADMILTEHLGDAVQNPSSLSRHKDILMRKFDVNKADYANAKALIRHSLTARVLQCVAQQLGFSTWDKFKAWQPHSYDRLKSVAADFVRAFATGRAAAAAQKAGDNVLAHSILFMIDALRFCDFDSAVSHADAERVLIILRYWAFEFRGAGRHNYARECAEVLLHWEYELTEPQRKMWASSWFVNSWGKPGRWIATDLYLEHLNYYVKIVHIADGSGVNVENIIKKGSACIEALREISLALSRFAGSSRGHRRHKEMKFEHDLQLLFFLLNDKKVHQLESTPERFLPQPPRRRKGRSKKPAAASPPVSSVQSLFTKGVEAWNTKWDSMLRSSTYDPQLGASVYDAGGEESSVDFSAADLGLVIGEDGAEFDENLVIYSE